MGINGIKCNVNVPSGGSLRDDFACGAAELTPLLFCRSRLSDDVTRRHLLDRGACPHPAATASRASFKTLDVVRSASDHRFVKFRQAVWSFPQLQGGVTSKLRCNHRS